MGSWERGTGHTTHHAIRWVRGEREEWHIRVGFSLLLKNSSPTPHPIPAPVTPAARVALQLWSEKAPATQRLAPISSALREAVETRKLFTYSLFHMIAT